MMTARMFRWAGIAALPLFLVGCVSQEKYNALKLERDRYAEQLGQAQNEASSARAEADALKNQLGAIMNGGNNKDAMVLNLTQQNAELQRQLDDINRRYADAVKNVGQGGTALPAALSNELSAFAAANPDLVDFDAARGIVKFKSDVTFAVGSAELNPHAREVIDRFASILNSAAANGYELMVAGHTDNQRVSNPATISAGHKDNWYLSAHRAIGVAKELLNKSVNPQRIGVVGYADQRPVASNASESGRAQNRRVEVLILPTTVRSGPAVTSSGGSSATPHRAARTPKPSLNKDGEAAPSMNK